MFFYSAREIPAFKAFALVGLLQLDVHALLLVPCNPDAVGIIAVGQRYDSLAKETLPTTVALLERMMSSRH